jgi:hypothetical protein
VARDLDELFDTLKAAGETVELSTENYKFDSVKELQEHFGPRPLFGLSIRSSQPFASIDLTRSDAGVYVTAGDHSAQLFREIDDVLMRCQRARHAPWLYSNWITVIILLIGLQPMIIPFPPTWPPILLGVQLALFPWWLWVGLLVSVGIQWFGSSVVTRRVHSLSATAINSS